VAYVLERNCATVVAVSVLRHSLDSDHLLPSVRPSLYPYQWGPGTSSTTLVYWLFEKGFNDYAMGYASAIAWLLFLMVIVITAIEMRLQRRWVHYES